MQVKASIIVLLCIISLYAKQAIANVYLGTTLVNATVDIENTTNHYSGNNYLLSANLGYFFNNNLALEMRYASAIARKDRFLIDDYLALYVKGNLPISNRFSLYALFGHSYLSLDGFENVHIKENDISYGLGVHYALSRNAAILAEFLSMSSEINSVENNEVALKTLGIGFQYQF